MFQERVKELFVARSKFQLNELHPYLSRYVGGDGQPKTVTEILLAHARIVDGYYMPKL